MNEVETGGSHPIATRRTAHPRAQDDHELKARFERQVMPFSNELHRAARRLTSQPGDAEDLVQETLLKAFVGFHSFQQGTNLGGWLHRIMTNTWINRYRASQRRPDERLADEITDAELLADARHTSAGLRSAETEALQALPDEEVTRAMQALPAGQRMAVYYADVEGLRYREIAEATHVPLGTVMSRVHRGRRTLQPLLVDVARSRGYVPAGPSGNAAA